MNCSLQNIAYLQIVQYKEYFIRQAELFDL